MTRKQFVFTNETPYLEVEITPDQILNITKFVSQNELTFVMAPSLGIRITSGIGHLGFHSFVSLMEHNQANAYVVDTDLRYSVGNATTIKIEINNDPPKKLINIAMLYTVEPNLH